MTYFVEFLNTLTDEVIRIGQADMLDDAIALAKGSVDDYLKAQRPYNRTANALYTMYAHAGLMPCIFRDDGETLNVPSFDHLQHASVKCVALYARHNIRSEPELELTA